MSSASNFYGGIDKMNRITDQTPLSNPVFSPYNKAAANFVSEEQLIAKLKKLMKMNLKNFCY